MERCRRLTQGHLLLALQATAVASTGLHAAASCSRSTLSLWPPLALRVAASCLMGDASIHHGGRRLSLLGVGSFENSPSCRLQLALLHCNLLLLLPESSAHTDLFDPILSAVNAGLLCAVPGVNDGCRHRADEPTLFYMPHYEASLYDAFFAINWEPSLLLRHVCVLGNNFHNYVIQAKENRSGPAANAKLTLTALQFSGEDGTRGNLAI
uniref:SRR1-like domain-containing protein n=1 Tax=Oryza nivara TaxID=4536 RepID=A0A0E0GP29_ORYNI